MFRSNLIQVKTFTEGTVDLLFNLSKDLQTKKNQIVQTMKNQIVQIKKNQVVQTMKNQVVQTNYLNYFSLTIAQIIIIAKVN